MSDRPSLAERLPERRDASPEELLDRFVRWAADAGFTLYPHQEEALLELYSGKHVVLSTPTGSGKSMVALGMHFKALAEGQVSFYTSPIKALASEKFFALCDDLGAANVGMLTGDASINPEAKVLCCTAEVLANMALRSGPLLDAPEVVMDEFHYYWDEERGWAWQVPLVALPATRFLLMSATLGDMSAIAERLERPNEYLAEVAPAQEAGTEVPENPFEHAVQDLASAVQGLAAVYITAIDGTEGMQLKDEQAVQAEESLGLEQARHLVRETIKKLSDQSASSWRCTTTRR